MPYLKKKHRGQIEHALQYIIPISMLYPPISYRTHLFSTLHYQDQMDPTVSSCIQALQPPFPPTTFLPLASLVYDTPQILSLCGFWQGKRKPSQSLHFNRQTMELEHKEEALGAQTGRSLPPWTAISKFSTSCMFVCLAHIFSFICVCTECAL